MVQNRNTVHSSYAEWMTAVFQILQSTQLEEPLWQPCLPACSPGPRRPAAGAGQPPLLAGLRRLPAKPPGRQMGTYPAPRASPPLLPVSKGARSQFNAPLICQRFIQISKSQRNGDLWVYSIPMRQFLPLKLRLLWVNVSSRNALVLKPLGCVQFQLSSSVGLQLQAWCVNNC